MCRLYGFRSTHSTDVECGLMDAQNALIRQAERDARGLVNDDGWGIGYVEQGILRCEREVGPAAESEEFRRDAASVDATTVLAHVRRLPAGLRSVRVVPGTPDEGRKEGLPDAGRRDGSGREEVPRHHPGGGRGS